MKTILYTLWGLAFVYGCLEYWLDSRHRRKSDPNTPKELEIEKVNRLMDNIFFK